MEVVVRRCSRASAVAAEITSMGSGWLAAAALVFAMDTPFQTARPTPSAAVAMTRSAGLPRFLTFMMTLPAFVAGGQSRSRGRGGHRPAGTGGLSHWG